MTEFFDLLISFSKFLLGWNSDNAVWREHILELSITIFVITAICYFVVSVTKPDSARWRKILFWAMLISTVFSCIVRIVMYVKCRSLWLDEAALAENIVNRDFWHLLSSPFVNGQSAPILYVAAVKIITIIFGNSEYSLRIFSLLSFFAMLSITAVFMRKVFNASSFRIMFVCFMCSILPSYIYYSNELKPYMSDAFFVVLSFLLYWHYSQGKIKLSILALLHLIVILFCSPSVFFIGGIWINEFLIAVKQKDKKYALSICLNGIFIVVIFAVYYLWWMSSVSEFMKQSWDNLLAGIGLTKGIKYIFSAGSGSSDTLFMWLFVPFAFFSAVVNRKNKFISAIMLGLILVFIASALGKWPIAGAGRLWLFLPVLILILAAVGYKKYLGKLSIFLLCTAILLLTANTYFYANENVYFYNEEINPLIKYIEQNVKDDENVYVYPTAKAVFQYKNGYNSQKIGNVSNNNVIYGQERLTWNGRVKTDELKKIIESKKCYLLFYHNWTGIGYGLNYLQKYGRVTKIKDVYGTPLYYFERY